MGAGTLALSSVRQRVGGKTWFTARLLEHNAVLYSWFLVSFITTPCNNYFFPPSLCPSLSPPLTHSLKAKHMFCG